MIQVIKRTRLLAGWGLLCLLFTFSSCDGLSPIDQGLELSTFEAGHKDDLAQVLVLPDSVTLPQPPVLQNSSDTTGGKGGVEDPIIN